MKAPGIYSALTFSFFLHIAFITLSFYLGKEFYTRKPAMHYVVSLVSPSQLTESGGGPHSAASSAAPEPAGKEIERHVEKQQVEMHTETRQKKKADSTIVQDRINELKAIQKIERLAELRKIVDIGAGQRSIQTNKTSSGSGSSGNSGGTNDYYAIVGEKIAQQWIFPDTLHADLETVVSIRIRADGSITIEKVEKSSGNPLFDRSVMRAINMASPLPPPLREMEMGLRFNPSLLRAAGKGH
ncbi:MAG: TonB C-terminal domain-containing protein [Nitrospirae bacterium]|nr:TonB C-terminal domain-containing protein [Nitrospirota bacterium]